MFTVPPSTKTHWVYDDPSGVPEPAPYARRWHPRVPLREPGVRVGRRRRLIHRES